MFITLTFSSLYCGKFHIFATIECIFKLLLFVGYLFYSTLLKSHPGWWFINISANQRKRCVTQLRRSFKQEVIYMQGAKLKQRKWTATRSWVFWINMVQCLESKKCSSLRLNLEAFCIAGLACFNVIACLSWHFPVDFLWTKSNSCHGQYQVIVHADFNQFHTCFTLKTNC